MVVVVGLGLFEPLLVLTYNIHDDEEEEDEEEEGCGCPFLLVTFLLPRSLQGASWV